MNIELVKKHIFICDGLGLDAETFDYLSTEFAKYLLANFTDEQFVTLEVFAPMNGKFYQLYYYKNK